MKSRNQKMIVWAMIGLISLGGTTVTTLAKSSNRFNKTVSVVQGTEIDGQKGLIFEMTFKAGEVRQGTTFYIQAKDFDLDQDAYKSLKVAHAKVSYETGNRLKVEVNRAQEDITVEIPVYGIVLKGNPRLIVDGDGSSATSGTYSLTGDTVVDRYGLGITSGEISNLSDTGKGQLADIIIDERAAGALVPGTTVRLKLSSNTNLKFKLPETDRYGYATSLEIEGLRGLSGTPVKVQADYGKDNSRELVLTLGGFKTGTARGGIKIKGLECLIADKNKALAHGPVEVSVRMDEAETANLTLAKVSQEGINLKVKQPVNLIAGKEAQTVEVTMSENVAGSLSRRHDVYFEIEGAKVVPGTLKMVSNSEVAITEERDAKTKEVKWFTLDTSKINPSTINSVTFSFDVQATSTDSGEIKLIADEYKLEEKVVIGKVQPALGIQMNPITLKTALKDQKGGSLIFTEAKANLFKAGDELVVEVEKAGAGIRFTDARVEAQDVRVAAPTFEDGKMVIKIERGSDEQAIIKLTDLEMYVEGLVEPGNYDIVLSGSAISDVKGDKVILKDKIKVVEKYTTPQPDQSGGLAKGVAYFKIGEMSYIVNDEGKTMDAAPYLAPGTNRVMVPVKYVSDAFGITEDKMHFAKEDGKSVVIIEAGERTLKLIDGSNLAEVNNVVKPMDEKVMILNGRTYVPVGEMARMLDIEVNWSNETKTAIFTNK